jgi:hypothetical protein
MSTERALTGEQMPSYDQLERTVYYLINYLKSLKETEHRECEDGWYSCVKANNYLREKFGFDDECSCGMDARNASIDAVLVKVRNLLNKGVDIVLE